MSVLILNKPKGLTSFQAVLQVKKLLNLKKAGHSGTLDPLATGLLPIFFDESTSFIKFLSNENKEYIASFHQSFLQKKLMVFQCISLQGLEKNLK